MRRRGYPGGNPKRSLGGLKKLARHQRMVRQLRINIQKVASSTRRSKHESGEGIINTIKATQSVRVATGKHRLFKFLHVLEVADPVINIKTM